MFPYSEHFENVLEHFVNDVFVPEHFQNVLSTSTFQKNVLSHRTFVENAKLTQLMDCPKCDNNQTFPPGPSLKLLLSQSLIAEM